jgi:hypothetical protein
MSAKSKAKPRYGKRTRPAAPQRPDAICFTIAGFQGVGGCGKTAIYELAKRGVLKLYKDPIGRTLIDGDSAREFLRNKQTTA